MRVNFNKEVSKCFLSLFFFNLVSLPFIVFANYSNSGGVVSANQQVNVSESRTRSIRSEYANSKDDIFRGMSHLKKAVELIVGRNFKNEDVEKFLNSIYSNKPFKQNNTIVGSYSNPLIKELHKLVLESWLILREACSASFARNEVIHPLVGISRRDALKFALTLGGGKDMGTYRTPSAIDFMEWWADSNGSFLPEKEQRILRKISEGKTYNFSKKFKDMDEMWETGNSAEFMNYWKAYGEGTLSDKLLSEADDIG